MYLGFRLSELCFEAVGAFAFMLQLFSEGGYLSPG